MRGIITHEESQAVASSFRAQGHEFYSCDIKPCSGGNPEWHRQGDFREEFWILSGNTVKFYDFFGAHPDCTFLTNAGIRWLTSKKPRKGYEWSEEFKIFINPERWAKMLEACDHFITVI